MNLKSFFSVGVVIILIMSIFSLIVSAYGSGTEADPYRVYTLDDLQNMNNDLDAHYILMNDIDASATSTWNGGKGFDPIGDSLSNAFEGTFDGQGYTISNLFIDRGTAYNGLFGCTMGPYLVDDTFSVMNLNLENVSITGGYLTGGLIGDDSSGGAYRCSVSGNVSGIDGVGGLIGSTNEGDVAESFTTGTVCSTRNVGGIVGDMSSSSELTNSYSSMNVSGDNRVGGLVGHVYLSTVTNSYSYGSVNGNTEVGGLIGSDRYSTVTFSYWNTETSGQSSSGGGTGNTTAEMQTQSTFVGWDFNDTWVMQGYPILKSTIEDTSLFILFDSLSDDTKSNETINVSGTVSTQITSDITINHNGNISSVPVENGSFTCTLNLSTANNITASGTDVAGKIYSATILLDGDMLSADGELKMGFDPLDPDSDSTLTPEDESGNGIPDGLETLDNQLPSFAKYRIGADPLKEDTDDDNLTDYFELMQLGLITDIGSNDTDGDGILDEDEDIDEDGLTNLEEQNYGTDPLKPDTDGDTLNDSFEVNIFGSNPLLVDSDDDGLEDDSEFRLGTDPNNSDTYGDGTPDGLRTFTSNASDSSLGTSVSINGIGDLAQNVSITQENSSYYTNISSMVSPLVAISLNESFNYVDISIEYDPSNVTNASNLSLCYFNETYGLYVPVPSTVDAANHSVSANVSHLSTWAVFDESELMALYKAISEYNHETYYGPTPSIPEPGDSVIVPYDSNVVITFLASNSGYNDQFGLSSPSSMFFGYGYSTPAGTVFDLGNYTNGTELILYLTNQPGQTFYSGPASRNPDNVAHAYVKSISDDTWNVGWEDLYGGGDRDYNDIIYNITFTNLMIDSDGDGLTDYMETHGIMDNMGNTYCTDPENPDTDGDGLTDGEETGVSTTGSNPFIKYSFNVVSNPKKVDSDNDGIDDPDEAEFSTEMLEEDTDHDGLKDGLELEIGTEPLLKDTDFDGHDDKEEYNDPDHDPLVYEKRYSHYEIIEEITLGAVFGEFGYDEHDSVYYLTGHLISGLVAVGDIRDLLASVSHGDELGVVLNIAAVVPLWGDGAKVVSNVGEFGAKHADEAGIVAIKLIDYVPSTSLKANVLKASSSDDFYGLVAKGFDDNSIIKLSEQGIDFVKFNKALDATSAFADYPGLGTFLRLQIDDTGTILKDRCTFNAKKAAAAQNAGKSTYVDRFVNNLKGAYTEDLLAKHIGGDEIVVGLSHVNKGGIDYAGLITTTTPQTLKIGEAKAVQSLSLSKLKNYITPNKVTGELEFNFNYARGKLGDEHLKDSSIQKEFVLYINSPESETIKQALDLPSSVQYSYKDRLGQMITETVTITVKTVSE
ncbi:DUF4114 domain-containing protein [uncultured Methanolobus sp.]|uniref:DUF4114 domain-containing protein n=1 Tax=uncultured Methanolobus sp. TaxID=218300 RepID=UPI002AAA928B|nr:DUF4114 domain-containing protein [uncultured Methanolobus sp.]